MQTYFENGVKVLLSQPSDVQEGGFLASDQAKA